MARPKDARGSIERGDAEIPVTVNGRTIVTRFEVSEREREHILAGGTINAVKAVAHGVR